MNNQKDTQKTSINELGQSVVPDVKSLANIVIYEFANKKTEKLVTALYMVSDCMDSDDALKGKLRQLGVELLSDMYKLSTLSPMDKHIHISSSLARVNEILSFVEIAYTIGFISEMNTAILKKEFMILIGELENHQKKDKHFTFTLDQQMFSLPENIVKQDLTTKINKRTLSNSMSFINNKSPLQTFQPKNINPSVTNLTDRQNRTDKILNIIKEKKDLSADKAGVSIKDISISFTNCSEKTIQRELNSLVSKGKLKKTGAKRWSRYSAI
jgi:hypothetical protein